MNLWSYSDPKFLFGFFFLTMLELQHSRFCNWHFQHRQHLLTFCCLLGCFPPTWLQSPGMSSSVLCFVGVSICCKIWCGFLQLLRCTVSHFLFCSGWFSILWFWSAVWTHFKLNFLSYVECPLLHLFKFRCFFVFHKVCAWNLDTRFTSFLFLVIVKSWSSFVLARLCFFISYCISICVSGLNSHFWEAVINLLFLSLGDFFSCLLSLAWQCF